MDFLVSPANINRLSLIWIILIGRIRNFNCKISLLDTVPPYLQHSYIENENEVRHLSELSATTIESLSNRKNRFCLIHDDDRVIGSIFSYMMGTDCYLNMLYVIPSYRRKKLGMLLVALILQDTLKNNSEVSTFYADPINPSSGNLLMKFNFRPQRTKR